MPGTEGADVDFAARSALIRSLTIAGWLLYGGAISMVLVQLQRVREFGDTSSFGTDVWDRRIEVLSFVMLPPNLLVLVPAVGVAAVASALSGPLTEIWLVRLVRWSAALAAIMCGLGAASLVSLVLRDEPGRPDIGDALLRVGGILMAAGLIVLCRAADRPAVHSRSQ